MKKQFRDELSQDVREKTRKNLVYVTIFSVAMIFAGLTSAYIVSKGGNFWVKIKLPTEFYISTAVILASSLTYILAIRFVKQGKIGLMKSFIVITTILGLLFAFFQYKGYEKINEAGAHVTGVNTPNIMVVKGRYGNYFKLKVNGKFLSVEDNQYLYNGKPLGGDVKKSLDDAAEYIIANPKNENLDGKIATNITIIYKDEPLSIIDGKLTKPNGELLLPIEMDRLYYLMNNVKDGRADFYMKGKLGEDFKLYYDGDELQYKNRELYMDGKIIPARHRMKLEGSGFDTATSYFFIITILHLAHVLATIIYLLMMTKRSLSGEFTQSYNLPLRTGAIFWHFLGALWVYLLLFLLFIH